MVPRVSGWLRGDGACKPNVDMRKDALRAIGEGHMTGHRKVIVIGGGAAGLAAAYALRKHGKEAIVLEAGDHAGGRMAGEEYDGYSISTGAQFLDTSCKTALRLADELEVSTGSLRFAGSLSQYRQGRLRRVTYANLLSLRLYSPKASWQTLKIMLKLGKRRGDLSDTNYAGLLDLDTVGESFADYATREAGREYVEQVCEPLAMSVVLAGPERLGTVFGVRCFWNAISNPRQAFRNPLRGVGSFATALSRACAGFTRLSTPVEHVVVEDGVVKGVLTKDGFEETAAVVCATTATDALKIIPGLPGRVRSVLSRVTYSSCCHAVFGVVGHPFTEGVYLMLLPRDSGYDLASFGDATVASPQAAPAGKGLIHAFASEEHSEGLFRLDDEEIKRRFIREIQRLMPAMPDHPLFARVYRWKEAVCLSPGGTLSAMHRLRAEGIPGAKGLFLAGEYTDIPGIEGSLNSGIVAADNALDFLSGLDRGARR